MSNYTTRIGVFHFTPEPPTFYFESKDEGFQIVLSDLTMPEGTQLEDVPLERLVRAHIQGNVVLGWTEQ